MALPILGRGLHYPIAQEGALKLKEISYIHAEAYAAGELKHGPLALVTSAMPVVTVAPNDALLEKLKSNLQEVRARGGVLYVLADAGTRIESGEGLHVIRMPEHYGLLSLILHAVPLQLLSPGSPPSAQARPTCSCPLSVSSSALFFADFSDFCHIMSVLLPPVCVNPKIETRLFSRFLNRIAYDLLVDLFRVAVR